MQPITQNEKNITILVIDDEENLCRLMKRVLERKGYNAIVAMSGKEGLELFEKNCNIGVVVLDINLPEISGIQILEILLHKKENLKVVLTSGVMETKEISECLSQNNVAFLQKPYDNTTFIESIESLLKK
ncbi:MAG: response regulator [Candidatus Brocadiae bacterium]|nr:response regulator [Candidatus Brocadiia bacterium]